MDWTVKVERRVVKRMQRLPDHVRRKLFVLFSEIERSGPVRGNWPNYSKLGKRLHHCHLSKGRPTYVAVWEEVEDSVKLIEVIYAGTHEKAPY